MTLRLVVASVRGEFAEAMRDLRKPMAQAASGAIREAAIIVEREGNAQMAAALSPRWGRALRVDVYPKNVESIDAAAYVKTRREFNFANVFERGSTIRGKPLLWIPLSNNQITGKGGRRLTPRQFATQIGPLFTAKRPGKPPLLVAKADRGKRGKNKITKGAFKRGASGQGNVRSVPVFVGVDRARLPDRLDITGLVQRVRTQLPQMYFRRISSVTDGR